MPSLAGNGGAAFAARGVSNGGSSPMHTVADSWLVQKLKNEWSSCDLGPLLTKERLADVVGSFPHLDTPIKVRLLLSFLSMRKEDFDASKFAVVEIVDAAEKDTEEWVKVGAGIVNQYLFMSRDGAESGTFLHEQLTRASAAVLDAVRVKMDETAAATSEDEATRVVVIEDFFCHENAYLSASVRPELAVQPAAHFTIAADAPGHGSRAASASTAASASGAKHKPPAHRPQLARPAASAASSSTAASSSAVPMRTAAAKPLTQLPPKKNMSELSSEIRRKADAGRFKRQRSRISVIDLDEVKQIEVEKAQKAEEQKKRLKATKDEKKTGAASGTGAGADAGGATEAGNGVDDAGVEKQGSEDEGGLGHDGGVLQEVSQYSEQDDLDHHDNSDREDHGESHFHGGQDDLHARHHHGGNAIAAGSNRGGGYAPQDGTQALLHAAFHSTSDVMNEVVASQQHVPVSSYQQHEYYHQRQSAIPQHHQQSMYSNRGFEPEDVHGTSAAYGSHSAYGYGAQYGAQFGDHAGGVSYADGPQYAGPNGGFGDDQSHQQHEQQQQADPRYDPTRDRGGFLDGPPEYWR